MKHLLFLIVNLLFAANVFSQKPDTLTSYKWQNNAWQPDARFIYTYTSSCLTASAQSQVWLTDSSSWRNATLTTYAYTANDSVSQATTQGWDTISGIWVNAARSTYSFGANNNRSQWLNES